MSKYPNQRGRHRRAHRLPQVARKIPLIPNEQKTLMSAPLIGGPVGGGQVSLGRPGRGAWRQGLTGCDHIRFEGRAIVRLKPSPRRHDSDVMSPSHHGIIGDRPRHVAFGAIRGVDLSAPLKYRNVHVLRCAGTRAHGACGRKSRIWASSQPPITRRHNAPSPANRALQMFIRLEAETKDETRLEIDFRSHVR